MAALYADEDVSHRVADRLRSLGHDVLTARDDGRAGQGIDDALVLARATELGRAVLTRNRDDFRRLHARTPAHAGIVTHTDDPDPDALAARIDAELAATPALAGALVRVVRPNPPPPPTA